jgi:hypothetical protein
MHHTRVILEKPPKQNSRRDKITAWLKRREFPSQRELSKLNYTRYSQYVPKKKMRESYE